MRFVIALIIPCTGAREPFAAIGCRREKRRWRSSASSGSQAPRPWLRVAEGRFCFERRGLWLPQVAIHQGDERGEELAIFEPQLWSRDGVLIGLHGPLYRWCRVHERGAEESALPCPCWEWQDLTERPLLHFKQLICLPHTRMSGMLTIEPAAVGLSLLPLLATLGWYLLVLYEHGATRPLPEVHTPRPRP